MVADVDSTFAQSRGGQQILQSIQMLEAVIAGDTYDAVAVRAGVTRTAVERRVKALALRLINEVGVPGISEGSVAFVSRLRLHRDAICTALEQFNPQHPPAADPERGIVRDEDIVRGAQRIRGRSSCASRDLALFYLAFASGARPLEIARLEVRDYLDAGGRIRGTSELRADAAINGRARPLYFESRVLNDAVDAYLHARIEGGQGTGTPGAYRGLDPRSRLFLTAAGEPFPIVTYGRPDQRRQLCRPILELYSKLFRYADMGPVTALSVRRTVITRLFDRGAQDDQIGLLLGISERSAVRERLPNRRRPMSELVAELL